MTDIGAIVRTGLNLVPICGGALANGWSEWDTSRRFSRIEETVSEIVNRLNNAASTLPGTLNDAEYQLLEEVLRRVQIEHRYTKRIFFAKLLVECWTTGINDSYEKRMMFVRALDRFDELHICILRYLDDLGEDQKHYPNPTAIASEVGIEDSSVREVLYPVLDLLAREFAFIDRNWTLGGQENVPLLTGNLGPENLVGKCGHKITSLGHEFLAYISDASED